MRTIIGLLGVAALVLTGGPAGAQDVPCDFVTGGGDIIPSGGTAKANFGIGGSCKAGGDGRTLWGHLEYIDHGFSTPTVRQLNVHWTDITGYFACIDATCTCTGSTCTGFTNSPGPDSHTRVICGTARTNQTSADVNWVVKVTDNREPGKGSDTFMIHVVGEGLDYTSEDHTLVGGNIQLHKPNNSGSFSGAPTSLNCPAFVPPTNTCQTSTDCPAGTDEICVAGACVCPAGTAFNEDFGKCCQIGNPACGD